MMPVRVCGRRADSAFRADTVASSHLPIRRVGMLRHARCWSEEIA